jgi:ATP-binding cassette subfamily B protein
LQYQKGALLVNDIPIGNYDLESYRKHIGVFYHEQDIFHGSLMENITLGDDSLDPNQLTEMAEAVGLKSFISSSPKGFDTMLETTGKGLSTIIAKKILLLRAFASRSELLLLDEPFELAGAEDCQKISNYLMSLKNASVFVVTGNLDYARKCDTVVILEKGRIKVAGNPQDILKTVGKA